MSLRALGGGPLVVGRAASDGGGSAPAACRRPFRLASLGTHTSSSGSSSTHAALRIPLQRRQQQQRRQTPQLRRCSVAAAAAAAAASPPPAANGAAGSAAAPAAQQQQPQQPQQQQQAASLSLADLWLLLRHDGRRLAACLAATAVSVLCAVTVAPCLGAVVDTISRGTATTPRELALVVGRLGAVYIVSNVCLAIQVRACVLGEARRELGAGQAVC